FDLLAMLIARRPAVVEKSALREHLWPGAHVVDANLGNLVAEIRRSLPEEPSSKLSIRTVHGVGYALAEGGDADDGQRCWVVWNQRPIVLEKEESVVGRDPASEVWIDGSGVSRRHARIRLNGDQAGARATIEDLGSTNGTFVGRKRVGT